MQKAKVECKGIMTLDTDTLRQREREASDYPFVSVIIPTYNRREILKKCLSALLAQTYPHDRYEIIVIDDGSTDGTREMIEQLVEEHGLKERSVIIPPAESRSEPPAEAGAEADGNRSEKPLAGVEGQVEAERHSGD